MAGSFASVVTCVEGNFGEQGVCADGYVQMVQDVFVIPAAEASAIQEFLQPFDPLVAAEFFGFAMAATVVIWFVSWAAGTMVQSVRRF